MVDDSINMIRAWLAQPRSQKNDLAREAGLTVAGIDEFGAIGEPGERLVMAAPSGLAEEFFDLVLACGF